MSLEKFIFNAYRMKRVLRQGWLDKVIGRKESIAEHSYNTTIIAFIIVSIENENLKANGKTQIDVLQVLLQALFHDFYEAKTFDIDHSLDSLLGKMRAKEIKKEIETASVRAITEETSDIPFDFAQLIAESDYKVKEIVMLADKLELVGQTKQYIKFGQLSPKIGTDFIKSAINYINNNISNIESIDKILSLFSIV